MGGFRLGGCGTGSWIGLWLTLMTGVLPSKWTSNAVSVSLTYLFSLAHEMLTKCQLLFLFSSHRRSIKTLESSGFPGPVVCISLQ